MLITQHDCEQLTQVLRAANIGVWDIDIISGTMFYSPELDQLCGVTPGTLAGNYQVVLQCIHPEDRARIVQSITDILATGSASRLDFRLLRPDGEVRWVEIRGGLLRDEQNRPRRALGVATDITERKQTECALRASNEELIDFHYAVSHDLEEPLRTVKVYAELLDKSLNGQHSQDIDKFIEFIRDGTNRLHMRLRDLRIYAEVGQDARDGNGLIDCNAILHEVCTDLQAAITESAAVITHDPLPMAPGSSVHFVELFQNLLSNAIKYRGSQPPIIHVSAEWKAGRFVFSVRDNGVGIDQNKIKEIFRPFKRLRGDLAGTGMGLAICKRIVERAGGRIWVQSEPGRGSTFFFTVRSTPATE
jgi:PAS domain S-box-containing protein